MRVSHRNFLVSAGDHFLVPRQTVYTLHNHSTSRDAVMAFTVIKPASEQGAAVAAAVAGAGGGDDGEEGAEEGAAEGAGAAAAEEAAAAAADDDDGTA